MQPGCRKASGFSTTSTRPLAASPPMLQPRAKPTLPWPRKTRMRRPAAAASCTAASSGVEPLSMRMNSSTSGSASTLAMLCSSASPVR